ncbi:Bifunctional riboflavin biosynthesis protein RIBA 1, chloroplastic, partial [Linum perenne]
VLRLRDFVTLVPTRKVAVNSRSASVTTRAASLTSGDQGSIRQQLLAKLTSQRSSKDDSYGNKNQNDFDLPTHGFDSIPEAVEDIRQGKMVIVVDDEGRENEGDLIMAASKATPEALSFIVKHGTGIVCVSMKGDHLERLQLPLMVPPKLNQEILGTAFTITVDAKHGTTTGVSAEDRATTIQALASKDSNPQDFNRPGHIFPLRYTERGVLARPGHTEASADLAILAGLEPVAVLTEIVDDDGSMARLPRLKEFAKEHDLKIISIFDMIRYLKKREETVKLVAAARMPTMLGSFKAHCYESLLDGVEHIAMVKGEIGDGEDVLVRIHSECLANDIFGSNVCDCGGQLDDAMKQIEDARRGVLVYLRGSNGKHIDLGVKLPSFVTDSNIDANDYDIAAKVRVSSAGLEVSNE